MAGTVTLTSHHEQGNVRAAEIRAIGDLADGTITAVSLRSLGLHLPGCKLLAIRTNPMAAATTVTLATSAAADDIIDTGSAHGYTAGTPVRFKTLTGGTGLNTSTIYYVSATSLAAQTFRVSAAASPDTPLGFSTDITAGTVTSDMFDAPTSNYDITLLDPAGADILNAVGADRHTTNTERALITGAPYVFQGEDYTLTFANQSVKLGGVDITLIYTPHFL